MHDLVDFVSIESRKAGKSAAKYIKGEVANGEYNSNPSTVVLSLFR